MARLIGLVLMILGIYLGVSIYTDGTDALLGRLSGSEEAASRDSVAAEALDDPAASEQLSGRAAPSAITSRVRDRVTSALEEGAHRDSGE